MTGQVKFLIGVLAVLVVLVVFQLRDDEKAMTVAAAGARGAKAGRGEAADIASTIPVVAALAFKPKVHETFERERSLFAYAKSPATLEMERQTAEAAARAAAEAAKVAEEARIERDRVAAIARAEADKKAAIEREKQAAYLRDHPPPPIPPDFPYEFVGLVGPKDAPFAILVDRSKSLVYVQAGEEVAGSFKIDRVGRKTIDLSYLDPRFEGQFKRVQLVSKPGLDLSTAAPASSKAKAGRRR